MVFLLENIGKFFDDHPEFSSRRAATIATAQEIAETGGIISGGNIAMIFKDLAPLFEEEMMSFKHIAIGVKALRRQH